MNDIRIIGFDADDTLWVNQSYFDEAEFRFRELLSEYIPYESVAEELLKVEIHNMDLLGFGVKAFTLSMVEAALSISENKISQDALFEIVQLGKGIMQKPVELLDGVQDVLSKLSGRYKLVVVTKGDLLDQERKLRRSSLEHYFHHVEIVSDKQSDDYRKLLRQLDCRPENFLMIGNSMKSDIVPVIELGAYAAYVPFHTTWAHETTDKKIISPNLIRIDKITEILPYLK